MNLFQPSTLLQCYGTNFFFSFFYIKFVKSKLCIKMKYEFLANHLVNYIEKKKLLNIYLQK